ncbi:MAG: ABC transporter substrate-binding protein [Desulfobacterales bacterium]
MPGSGKKHRYTIRLAVLVLVFLIGAGCGRKDAADGTIVYRLKWLFNTSVVGDLYADAHRFFAAEGLKVEIREGGPERDALREIELGRAQFGVASADQVIRALAKGVDVVVLAQFFQINPLQWIYRPEQMKITGLSDLKGQVLGVTFGGNDETILKTLLARAGLTEADVTLYSVRYDYTPFIQKTVNFWPVYRNTQAVFLAEKLRGSGDAFAFFNPADYGVRLVANSLVTSGKIIERDPETVRKFTTALLKGWRAALEPANADRALETLRRYDKDSSTDVLREELAVTRSLVQPDPAIPIGFIDTAAWKQTAQIMVAQGLVPAPVRIDSVLREIPRP